RVTVFMRMITEILKQGGALEHLQDNYRSAGPLVEFANRLSEKMIDGAGKFSLSADVDTSYRIGFLPADVMRAASKERFLGISYIAADAGVRAAEGRLMQAQALARLLRGWKSSGLIQSWREVAVLFRVMTNVDLLVDAFEREGVPVYVVQGTS